MKCAVNPDNRGGENGNRGNFGALTSRSNVYASFFSFALVVGRHGTDRNDRQRARPGHCARDAGGPPR